MPEFIMIQELQFLNRTEMTFLETPSLYSPLHYEAICYT
jgi:hypothetical protein